MTVKTVAKWREETGLSQGNAAAILGISRRALINYEAGKRPTPSDLFDKLDSVRRGELPENTASDTVTPEKPRPKPRASRVTYPADMPEPDGPEFFEDMYLATPPTRRVLRWRRVQLADGTTRLVHPMIPRPIGRELESWRYVATESGAVYDFETAHKIR